MRIGLLNGNRFGFGIFSIQISGQGGDGPVLVFCVLGKEPDLFVFLTD